MQKVEPLVESLLALADKADEIGETEKADIIASVLSKASLLKFAQYEGFQQYCIMNSRAFQKAWKEKYQKSKKTDPETGEEKASAQEAWLDVLEEYQQALMGNQEKFLESYASKSWFKGQNKVATVFMNIVMEKVASSVHPGIAVLETLDEMADGRTFKSILNRVKTTVSSMASWPETKDLAEKTLVEVSKLEKDNP